METKFDAAVKETCERLLGHDYLTKKSYQERYYELVKWFMVAAVVAIVGWTILLMLFCQFVFDAPKP